ncbi:TlpA disulfide reductase family protein [Lutibacter sp. TH_r2]|uniref:TlpA family protein disulfide reductase n=1 Tax=Lutibacter sp. TH_r2 TaxID=3082083 RepID=UPI002954AC24|nr:TlpA disulfide reductase family protein [Lutibacter sp. TH_r2]MDV7187240.1 TlpA disulfide reductase family protein [Lutibacter sp. TH_r2]
MKRIMFFIALMLVVSCKKETAVEYAIISGKIINKSAEDLTVISSDRYFKQVIKVNEDGSFLDTLKVEPNKYILYQGRNGVELFIENGSSIKVDFDAENMDSTLVITGKGSEISNYLLLKNKRVKEIIGNGPEIYKKNEADYKATRIEAKNAAIELLNSTSNISEAFKAKELRNINYDYISNLTIFERYHAHYAQDKDFKASENLLADVEKVTDFNNEEDFMFSQGYKNMVNTHYREAASKLIETDSISEDIAFLVAVSKAENEKIKNQLLFDDVKYGITYTENLEDYYKLYMDNSSNNEHKAKITESYNKLKTVAKGQPSPKFVDYENFNGGTTSLDDFKGKYVYIDVWATWCGPCKREIPSLKELEKKYHGKNIEFISISVDKAKDHETWKKMVTDLELKGVQLFADKDWESDFVKDYLIKGIPRFILIDTEGNIINSNAKRPSDSKLINDLNKLNI